MLYYAGKYLLNIVAVAGFIWGIMLIFGGDNWAGIAVIGTALFTYWANDKLFVFEPDSGSCPGYISRIEINYWGKPVVYFRNTKEQTGRELMFNLDDQKGLLNIARRHMREGRWVEIHYDSLKGWHLRKYNLITHVELIVPK